MNDHISINEQLHGFIDNLELSLKTEFDKIDCDNIILCGMGGSSISNDIISDLFFECSDKMIMVVKSPVIPNWANEKTLAILVSYSGNTTETVDAYKRTIERGCLRIVISAGGELGELAEKNNDMFIKLPSRMYPRHSIGFMIGYIVDIIRAAGNNTVTKKILDAIDNLKEYQNKLENDKKIIEELCNYYINRVPIICSYSEFGSIILRWKTQFNENSKMIAFCNSFHEMNCVNVSKLSSLINDEFSLTLIIKNDDELKNNTEIKRLVANLDKYGISYKKIEIGGKTTVESMLRTLMLGDYLSIRLAEMEKIDPEKVPPIDSMKEKMREYMNKKSN